MTKTLGLLLLFLSTPALAHLVAIDPSTCALTIGLVAPSAGVAAIVDPPAATDLIRVSYEPDASPTRSRVQVCPADPADPSKRCGAIVPRAFVAGGVSGTIALPSAFDLRMLSTGDLDAAGVPITITLGGTPTVVPFDLHTGLVAVGTSTALGAPIDASGAVTLVGTGTSAALPAPFGGAGLRLQLGCTLAPMPDLDQFALAPRLSKVRGTLKTSKTKLVMTLESELAMAVDPALPTIVHLVRGDTVLIEQVLPMHSGPRGRSVSDDGTLTIIPVRRPTTRVQKIVLHGALAAGATLATGDGELALSAGGLMARRAVALKAKGRAAKAGVREQ